MSAFREIMASLMRLTSLSPTYWSLFISQLSTTLTHGFDAFLASSIACFCSSTSLTFLLLLALICLVKSCFHSFNYKLAWFFLSSFNLDSYYCFSYNACFLFASASATFLNNTLSSGVYSSSSLLENPPGFWNCENYPWLWVDIWIPASWNGSDYATYASPSSSKSRPWCSMCRESVLYV
mgnify:CR=1 FL=1